VVLVGKDYLDLPQGFIHFSSTAEAKEWYQLQKFENAQVLVKGSRSMEMEKVIE
jgi:UDP-N-acetylmuramoyl-tripeptide--D-alanyl-D-alanine ligase